MAVVQSAYSERIGLAEEGQIANTNDSECDTRTVEGSNNIPFGRACGQGTNDRGAVLGGVVANFVGVAVKDITLAPVSHDSAYLDHYPPASNMACLTDGDIWVKTKNAVAAGNTVYYDATTGLWDDASSGNVGPVPNARWMTSAASGKLAVVRIGGLK